jgi:hypothetical protein
MTAHRAVYFMERFKREEKMLGPNEQAALDFVISILEQQALAQQEQEPAACLVRNRSVRTPARIAADGLDHMGDWSEWSEASLSYGLAVTDPTRNYPQGACQYEMRHLFTHPPRREWQELTREGINQMMAAVGWQNAAIRQADLDKVEKVVRAVESRLKELNT